MTIPYRIERIETRQFALFPDKLNPAETVEVQSSYEFAVSDQVNAIRCRSLFHYVQTDQLLLVLEMISYFSIAPEGIAAIKKNGFVPVDFLRYMGTIAVGTARGIIHAKTEGTTLNAIVLPPINLVDIIKDDLVVSQDASAS